MTTNDHQTDPVERMLVEMMKDDLPPEVEANLHARMAEFRRQVVGQTAAPPSRDRMLYKRRLTWFGGAVAAAVAVLAMSWAFYSPSARAYAAAMQALESAESVHATGWIIDETGTFSDGVPNLKRRWPVEVWEWTAADGKPRYFEREGTRTIWDDGERRYEHRVDWDMLFVRKSQQPDLATRFPALAQRLHALKDPAVRKTKLPRRETGDRTAWGIRIQSSDGERREVWFDVESDLPVELRIFQRRDGQWLLVEQRTVTYNVAVPREVSAYEPPATGSVSYDPEIDPAYEAWRLHLGRLAKHIREQQRPERMALFPRDTVILKAASARLPGFDDYHVWPVDGTVREWLRGSSLYRRMPGRFRVPAELGDLPVRHDLVCRSDVSEFERIRFVLESLGLQLVERTEPRRVWVARHDGRRSKPWPEVKAPVPMVPPQALTAGMATVPGEGNIAPIAELFRQFAFYQDGSDLSGNRPIIVDETGLPSPNIEEMRADRSLVGSSQTPYWGGEASLEIARRWFRDEFGVAFSEETRPMIMYVVQRDDSGSGKD